MVNSPLEVKMVSEDPTSPLSPTRTTQDDAAEDKLNPGESPGTLPTEGSASGSAGAASEIIAPSPSKYVTTRAGLGKLMSVQLFHNDREANNKADKYFNAIGMGVARALQARETLGWELAILCIVGLAYGGGHLATWNNTFPSTVEKWMWKGCALVTAIAVGAPIHVPQHDLILLGRWFCGYAGFFCNFYLICQGA